jgi:hypothetical protein
MLKGRHVMQSTFQRRAHLRKILERTHDIWLKELQLILQGDLLNVAEGVATCLQAGIEKGDVLRQAEKTKDGVAESVRELINLNRGNQVRANIFSPEHRQSTGRVVIVQISASLPKSPATARTASASDILTSMKSEMLSVSCRSLAGSELLVLDCPKDSSVAALEATICHRLLWDSMILFTEGGELADSDENLQLCHTLIAKELGTVEDALVHFAHAFWETHVLPMLNGIDSEAEGYHVKHQIETMMRQLQADRREIMDAKSAWSGVYEEASQIMSNDDLSMNAFADTMRQIAEANPQSISVQALAQHCTFQRTPLCGDVVRQQPVIA